ncbi:MAG: CHAP domain-containing protein [bacterium]
MAPTVYDTARQLNNTTAALLQNTGAATSAANPFGNVAPQTASIFNPSQANIAGAQGSGGNPVQIAMSLLGKNEADGSYLSISQGRKEAWCADTVSHIWEKANGGVCPWGYNGGKNYKAAVSQIREWAQQNGCYAKQNTSIGIKPGDCIVFGSEGSKHIGLVKSVDPDGTIHTIEGNSSNAVREKTYKSGDSSIHGFVKMDKYRTNSTSLVA